MSNEKLKISTGLILIVSIAGLSGCSVMNKMGKSARNLTTFGSNNSAVAVDDKLIIPPGLKRPAAHLVNRHLNNLLFRLKLSLNNSLVHVKLFILRVKAITSLLGLMQIRQKL